MTFGYARVSTKTQARDGNSLDAQQAALTAAGAEKIYTDTFTGTKMDRPEWDRLRAQLRRGDVLIVTKLDRLARSVSQASGMITEMIDEGVTINVLNLGILSNDSVNTLLRNVLLSFAQFERDMIVQRTQEGKAVARATDPNFREGRPPKFDTEQLDHAMLESGNFEAQIIEKLKENGCRITKQRKMLINIILENECSSCKEIFYKASQEDENIGVATVYRMINALEEIGAINRKNMYKVDCAQDCPEEGGCIIMLDDDTIFKLTETGWNKVVREGLKHCGYVKDQKVTSIKLPENKR